MPLRCLCGASADPPLCETVDPLLFETEDPPLFETEGPLSLEAEEPPLFEKTGSPRSLEAEDLPFCETEDPRLLETEGPPPSIFCLFWPVPSSRYFTFQPEDRKPSLIASEKRKTAPGKRDREIQR